MEFDEDMNLCAYCGDMFNYDEEGYIDDATGLAFCDAPCEMHYDMEAGLPNGYVLAGGTVVDWNHDEMAAFDPMI